MLTVFDHHDKRGRNRPPKARIFLVKIAEGGLSDQKRDRIIHDVIRAKGEEMAAFDGVVAFVQGIGSPLEMPLELSHEVTYDKQVLIERRSKEDIQEVLDEKYAHELSAKDRRGTPSTPPPRFISEEALCIGIGDGGWLARFLQLSMDDRGPLHGEFRRVNPLVADLVPYEPSARARSPVLRPSRARGVQDDANYIEIDMRHREYYKGNLGFLLSMAKPTSTIMGTDEVLDRIGADSSDDA